MGSPCCLKPTGGQFLLVGAHRWAVLAFWGPQVGSPLALISTWAQGFVAA